MQQGEHAVEAVDAAAAVMGARPVSRWKLWMSFLRLQPDLVGQIALDRRGAAGAVPRCCSARAISPQTFRACRETPQEKIFEDH